MTDTVDLDRETPARKPVPDVLRFHNGCEIDLGLTDGLWRGLGAVRVDGRELRDDTRPILPEIRSPEAVEFSHWRLVSHRHLGDGGLELEFEGLRQDGGMMEWMLHRVHNRYRVSDWSARPRPAPETRLVLELRPARRSVGGQSGKGFSYVFRYRSEDTPIYKILDRSTWEPGGSILDCEFWMRQSFEKSVMPFASADIHYSTEWWLAGCRNPSVFQFQPFQTQFCGFTYTASRAGALMTWVNGVSHVRSLFEKPRGWTSLVHLHEHCGDLAHEFATRPVEVLWFTGERDRIANANLWENLRVFVSDRLHREAGLREERVEIYGSLEEWCLPDIDLYTREGVPALLAAGVRQLYIPNMFQNNMNTWGVSNFCCTVDYKIAETVGTETLRRLCDRAHAGGATVHHWGNTALSSYTYLNAKGNPGAYKGRLQQLPEEDSVVEILRDNPDAFVRNMAGHIEADHYTHTFCQLNLRDPAVVAYWHRRWREARDQVGFDGIFLDSSVNLSSDKFHWVGQVDGVGGATMDQTRLYGKIRPAQEPPKAILTQYYAHLELVREMQGYGYHYNTEDCGVFGTHRTGPDITRRLDCLFLWPEFIATFDAAALLKAGVDPMEVFFKVLAYRCVWNLYWHVPTRRLSWSGAGKSDEQDQPTPFQLDVLRVFNDVGGDMIGREILPGESGVRYSGGAREILWSFVAQTLPLPPGCIVTDAHSGCKIDTTDCVLRAEALRVYILNANG